MFKFIVAEGKYRSFKESDIVITKEFCIGEEERVIADEINAGVAW